MGLDMMLFKHLNGSRFNCTCFESEGTLKHITFEAGYWRKANAIHGWFVKNVQGGNDNCGEYTVYPEQLEELYSLCMQGLQASDLGELEKWGEEMLPRQEGFFFGAYEYDEYYLDDLKHTMEVIDSIRNDDGHIPDYQHGYSYTYISSW